MSSAAPRRSRHRRRVARRSASFLASTASILTVVAVSGPAQAGTRPDFCDHDERRAPAVYLCAKPGDIVDVRIGGGHPTQPSLGYNEVYYKLGRYTMAPDPADRVRRRRLRRHEGDRVPDRGQAHRPGRLRAPLRSDGDHGIRGESAFLMCSIRLVTQYAASDRVADATALGRLLALRNDLGLLSEEYDATTGHLVGNYPQAFSHLALIQVAEALTRSRSAASP